MQFPCIHFERYADDIVVHCRSETQLKMVERQIRQRFTRCGLELSHEKTKIVYCKDSSRDGEYPNQSFDIHSGPEVLAVETASSLEASHRLLVVKR